MIRGLPNVLVTGAPLATCAEFAKTYHLLMSCCRSCHEDYHAGHDWMVELYAKEHHLDQNYRVCCTLWNEFEARATAAVDVVAAVRLGEPDMYWLCQRNKAGAHGGLAGWWEYPGGKVEPGELHLQALEREMREEFDADVSVMTLMDTILSPYAHDPRFYKVHFYLTAFRTDPVLKVHSQALWVPVARLHDYPHLPAGTVFNRRRQYLAARRRNDE